MPQRVFITDDNPDVIEKLKEKFAAKGFEVLSAENGKDALNVLNINTTPNLIISDTDMPEMDGLEFCKRIRKDPRLKSIPVIILKSKTTNERPYREVGVEEFISKPISVDPLLGTAEILIEYGSRSKIPQKSKVSPEAVSYTHLTLPTN